MFRHGRLGGERPDACTQVLPFATAARVFAGIDAALPPGGLLAWGNAHFRLADMPGGDRFELLEIAPELPPADVLYGPDDRRLDRVTDRGGIYRKR